MSVATDSVSISQDSRSSVHTPTGSVPFTRWKKMPSATNLLSQESVIANRPGNQRRLMSMSDASPLTPSKLMLTTSSKTSGSDISTQQRLPRLSETRRMNMKDIVIWQKFTRSLKQRVADRRNEKRTFCWLNRSTSTRESRREDLPVVELEPTYRTEPPYKLPAEKCRELMEDFLSKNLKSISYDSIDAGELSTSVCENLKDLIKAKLLPDRYKCVVYVVIGKKCGQGVQFGSLCAWNPNHDNQVSCNFQNNTLFCSATAFVTYFE